MSYLLDHAGRPIPQSEAAKPNQVMNSAGGFVFALDQWKRLDRFLILGSEGNTYYTTERKLTNENITNVKSCISSDGLRVVRAVRDINETGRAPKQEPGLYVLALCAKQGNDVTRKAAYEAVESVCRTGTSLYHFVNFCNSLGGWSRGLRRAVVNWFNNKPTDKLAYQLVKYQQRNGWSARDLLRLSHPFAKSEVHNSIYKWVVGKPQEELTDFLPGLITAAELAKQATESQQIVQLIHNHDLPREAIPTKWLTSKNVWAELAIKMPITATIRNLATMTRVGVIEQYSEITNTICDRITNPEIIKNGRVHPIQMLSALKTYAQGHGERSDKSWIPTQKVIDALDAGFYLSFDAIEPTNKHTVCAIDVSGSMDGGSIAGVSGLTPRDAAVAMAMVTAKKEKRHVLTCFTDQAYEGCPISASRRLDDNINAVRRIPFGRTDCAVPILHATSARADIDTFIIYTDNETWFGSIHPFKALERFRKQSGINAKLIVVGFTSTGFSIANPDDPGMLDVVGFDASAPSMIADFSRDNI
jgi:60 kDa SS-A/Ro ribonucleoprotein